MGGAVINGPSISDQLAELDRLVAQYYQALSAGNTVAAASCMRAANEVLPIGVWGRKKALGSDTPTEIGNAGLAKHPDTGELCRVWLEPMCASGTSAPDAMREGRYSYRLIEQASLSQLLGRYSGSIRHNDVSAGEWQHFKSVPRAPKHYRVFGTVVHERALHVLYTAMYPPYNGLLALHPLNGSGGFFTRVVNGARPEGYPPHFGARFTLVRAMTPAEAAEGI